MSVDVLGTSWDQCRSMVQYSFTSTETRRLVRTDSPGRPPRLSHSSWTMKLTVSDAKGLETVNKFSGEFGNEIFYFVSFILISFASWSAYLKSGEFGNEILYFVYFILITFASWSAFSNTSYFQKAASFRIAEEITFAVHTGIYSYHKSFNLHC